jgi:hypothetical protein
MGVSDQRHAPAALYPLRKDPRYPLYRRLGGHSNVNRSVQVSILVLSYGRWDKDFKNPININRVLFISLSNLKVCSKTALLRNMFFKQIYYFLINFYLLMSLLANIASSLFTFLLFVSEGVQNKLTVAHMLQM